ncbi:hypothetical protein LX36DRAFT_662416 [Colletotrichum falcatum]|nr:hypothetical protein LX36DRAFT_662416 [Colletotrichum falcatum]
MGWLCVFKRRYNHLPRIHEHMQSDRVHVAELLRLIENHGYHKKLGLHLLHKHEDIADGTIRLESDLGVVSGSWNRATPIDSIDVGSIHATAFRYMPEENRLVPFEFAKGSQSIMLNEKDLPFLVEFASYLKEHSLADALALEVAPHEAGSSSREGTTEIEIGGAGTVVLSISMVNNKSFLPTGWFCLDHLDDSEPPKGQTWSKMTNGSHKVFNNNSVGTPVDLVQELTHEGVIKAQANH